MPFFLANFQTFEKTLSNGPAYDLCENVFFKIEFAIDNPRVYLPFI